MNRYTVTLESDDGREFKVTVPANSRKAARAKADRLYDDDEVKGVELDDSSNDDDNDSKSKSKKTKKGAKGGKDGGKVNEDDESEDEDEDEDKDEDEDEETDEEPQEEHWWFRGRK